MFREEEVPRIVLRRWPKEGTGVRFTLTYRGSIPPEKRGIREEKHDIRRQLHPQLRQCWHEHRSLKESFRHTQPYQEGTPTKIQRIADNFGTFGFCWVPLVRREEDWACSLNIAILARQPPFGPFNGRGDLDNRVKTLIDGLCRPRQKSDLPDGVVPSNDENPFYCLLEDDSLIFDFAVSIERLLRPPGQGEGHDDVEAIIRVVVKTTEGEDPFSVWAS